MYAGERGRREKIEWVQGRQPRSSVVQDWGSFDAPLKKGEEVRTD